MKKQNTITALELFAKIQLRKGAEVSKASKTTLGYLLDVDCPSILKNRRLSYYLHVSPVGNKGDIDVSIGIKITRLCDDGSLDIHHKKDFSGRTWWLTHSLELPGLNLLRNA